MHRSIRISTIALAAAVVAAVAAPALANGRKEAPVALHFKPGSDTDIYLQATFGILESHDAGATFRWVCEDAMGYSGNFDPDYLVTATGAMFATTFDGLKVRRDGCVFDLSMLGATQISAITEDAAGTTIYAAASDSTVGAEDHKIYKSTDDGVTFKPTGATTPGDEVWWSTFEVAPSNAQVVYVSGYRFPTAGTRVDTLYKSVNAGTSWTPLSLADFTPVSNISEVLIASISPDDPNFVMAIVTYPKSATAIGNAIYRSINGGASWTQVKEFDDYVGGVVIRKYAGAAAQAATKAEVVIGTRFNGAWVSSDGGQTFTQVSQPPPNGIEVRLIQEHGGVLWAGANGLPTNTMALGKHATADTWTSVLEFDQIAGTLSCPSGTKEEDVCNQMRWCGMRDQLRIVPNPTNCTSAGADGTPMDGVPLDGPVTVDKPKGCCDAGGSPAGAIALSGFALIPFVRRRDRSRQRRH